MDLKDPVDLLAVWEREAKLEWRALQVWAPKVPMENQDLQGYLGIQDLKATQAPVVTPDKWVPKVRKV